MGNSTVGDASPKYSKHVARVFWPVSDDWKVAM